MPDSAKNHEGPTILLVEDDHHVRELLAAALARRYRVLQAENGARALEVFEHESGAIELVITDIRMPVLDGIALAERLAEHRSPLRMLFISGYFEEDDRTRSLIGSGNEFLAKPFSPHALVAKVDDMLGRPQRHPQDRVRYTADPLRSAS